MLQAGPRAHIKAGITTITQLKRALQLVQRPVHRASRSERSVVCPLRLLRAAVLGDHWIRVILTDQNVRETLIVAQQDIVLGLKLFDQVLLKQKRFCFSLCRQKHHGCSLRNHRRNTARMPSWTRII